MNKRKLATLVAASFAGLMLSSPSFATHASKAQSTSGGSTPAQTTASASGAQESRSIERADKKATGPQESHRTGSSKPRKPEASATERAQDKAVASANAKTEAEAEYKAALEKCDAQPTGQRSACVQDAEEAQTLALQQSRDGTASSGAPQESHRTGTSKPSKPGASEERATERAEDKAVASANAKTDVEAEDKAAEQSRDGTSASRAPESRSIERADKKAAGSDASRNAGTNNQTASERAASSQKAEADAKAEYKAAVEKCDAQPTGQRSACVQDAEKAQTLAMQQSRGGTSSSEAPKSRSIERADDNAAKSDASSNTAMKHQTDSNTPRKTGAPENRVPGKQSAK